MKEQKIGLNSLELRNMANKVIEKAKKRKLIKPLSEAFKDVKAKDEIHKGKIENI